jgi:hypothetical protein
MAEVHGLVCHGAEDVTGHRRAVGVGGYLHRQGEGSASRRGPAAQDRRDVGEVVASNN